MNKLYLSAAIISLMIFLLHLAGGEFVVHRPLLQSSISFELKAFVSVLWHTVTAMIALNTLALFWIARQKQQNRPLAALVAGQNLTTSLMFIGYGLLYHGSLLPMPQWTFFILISILILVAMQNNGDSHSTGDAI